LIPRRNVRHLMLDAKVVAAVREGRFHIYTADDVGEGMALLTGVVFGDKGVGPYAVDSVLGRAQKTLQRFRRACAASAVHHGPEHPKGHRSHL